MFNIESFKFLRKGKEKNEQAINTFWFYVSPHHREQRVAGTWQDNIAITSTIHCAVPVLAFDNPPFLALSVSIFALFIFLFLSLTVADKQRLIRADAHFVSRTSGSVGLQPQEGVKGSIAAQTISLFVQDLRSNGWWVCVCVCEQKKFVSVREKCLASLGFSFTKP